MTTLDTLEKLANSIKAQHKGPWVCDTHYVTPEHWLDKDGMTRYEDHGGPMLEGSPDVCKYVAAANPATILALIGRLRRAEEIIVVAVRNDHLPPGEYAAAVAFLRVAGHG